jgi:tetratricopeptide (TPR) repeat protein
VALNALRPINEVEGFRPLFEYHAALISDFADRPAEAEDHFRRAIDGDGSAAGRLVSAAGAFLERQGRPDEAKAIYARHRFQRDATNDAPTRIANAPAGIAEGLFDVASALRQENSQPLTLGYARLALGLVPDMPDALLLVGEILDGQGQRTQAQALYERVPPQSSAGWQARLRIAETLHAQGRTDEALSRLDAMARERPDRLDPMVVKGQMLRVRERFAEAVTAYDAAVTRIDKVERRHWALFYARGIALERAKQWPRAEADFRRALELEPDQPDVLNYLAYSWVDQGVNFERAREMLDRAVSLRPNSGHIVDSLGWVLYRTGKFQEAVPVLERAVELQPEDPVLLDHLGDAYWRVGRILEATFQWRRALGNKPDAEVKANLERKLQGGIPTATSERRN